MRRPTFALAAVMAVGGVLGSAGVAAAESALTPGHTRTVVLAVPESWAAARQVDIAVGTLTQLENGCLEPEADAGDVCDPDSGEGELAEQLVATVTLGVGDSACQPVVGGASLDLVGQRTTRLTTQSAGVDCVLVDLTFRNDEDGSDNIAQSDTLDVTLRLVARDFVDTRDPNEAPTSVDGQGGDGESPDTPDGGGGTETSTDGQVSPDGQVSDGTPTENGQVTGTDTGDARGARPAAADGAQAGTVSEEPADEVGARVVEGSVLDRMDAQVSVGDEGVAVQTQSADVTIQSMVLAWGSLFLGVVAVGWVGFWMVLRRRRKKVVA